MNASLQPTLLTTWRSMLAIVALLLASCGGGGDGGGGEGGGGSGAADGGSDGTMPAAASQSCPLTKEQTQKSIETWKPIAQFLTTEPRCVNCHGAVNPYIDGVGVDSIADTDNFLRPVSRVEHGGGQIDRPKAGGKTVDSACVECHDNMVRPNANTPAAWTLPLASHAFLNKDATTLCRQIKGALQTASRFMGHMENDEGSTDFVDTSFLGNRALGDLKPSEYKPPSIAKSQFLQLGRDWVDAMGGKFQGDASCGCEPTHSGWSGQIDVAMQTDLQRPRVPGEAIGRGLKTITITVTDGKGTYTGEASLRYDDPIASWDGGPIVESTKASGSATVPVELQVEVDDAGKYTILLTYPARDIEGLVIGTMTDTYCSTRYGTCSTQNSLVFMPKPPPAGAFGASNLFTGTLTDHEHIRGALAWGGGAKNSAFGKVQNAVTVNLWRSPP